MRMHDLPDARGHFGPYGGVFVAETLTHALEQLLAAYREARRDPAFDAEFRYDLKHYVGRPSPVYHAKRWSQLLGGAQIYLKREDLNHTGAHKINNTIGQALLARRMGKPRVIAETGAGMHGVATATVAARYGMQCVVYMGSADIKRQAQNVYRMKLLGATVVPVESGSKTLKDALNEAMRDWVTNIDNTFYIIGTVAGPHPYPMMVRDFQSVIGEECKVQMPELAGRQPDAVIACVGGGSNAMGIFYPYIDVDGVRLIGVEAAGEGLATGRHAASLCAGRPGVLHGNRTYLLQDADGQIIETHSVSAGLDYPGVGPARLAEGRGARRVRRGDRRRRAARFQRPMPLRRHHPGAGIGPRGGLCCADCAGNGAGSNPPRQPIRPRRQGHAYGCRARRAQALAVSRIQARFEVLRKAKRKALIPYITAGDPSPALTLPLMRGLVEAGCDILELGVPFSDPMADGPVIQRSSERALKHGVSLSGVLGMVRDFRHQNSQTPLVLMGYANPIEAMGVEKFVREAKVAGVDGVIVVDYPPEECEQFAALMRQAGIDPIFLLAPTSTERRIQEVARVGSGYLYYVSLRGVTGAGHIDLADVAAHIPKIRAATQLPIGVGFGIRDAESARRVAQTADAVVIGSRIIQEIEDAGAGQAVARVKALLRPIREALDA